MLSQRLTFHLSVTALVVLSLSLGACQKKKEEEEDEASKIGDGTSWSVHSMPLTLLGWTGLSFGDGRFIAFCPSQNMSASSTDGINWGTHTPGARKVWTASAYHNGHFVATMRDDVFAARSGNGQDWTVDFLSFNPAIGWEGIAGGGGAFVAVSSGRTNNGATVTAYSTDGGATFTDASMPLRQSWMNIEYGDGKFIATALYDSSNSATDKAALSTNGGVTWTTVTLPAADGWRGITYGDGKFVTVAGGHHAGSSNAAVSQDGTNWTASTLPAVDNWMDVAYGNGVFVAIGTSYAATSVDGITWNLVTLPLAKRWHSIAFGNGKFVVTNNEGDEVLTSP